MRCLDTLKQREINFRNFEAQMDPENLRRWKLMNEEARIEKKKVISVHIARLKNREWCPPNRFIQADENASSP